MPFMLKIFFRWERYQNAASYILSQPTKFVGKPGYIVLAYIG